MDSNVTMIGLGPMGVALAQALIESNHRVTVWNRTGAKAKALVEKGCVLAPSAASAVDASPVVIVCVADYAASQGTLDTKEVTAVLDGKVLVQLSTGTPQDAHGEETWARARGVDYLDRAILATPSQIGRPDTPVFLSGSETAFRKSEPI